MNEAQTDVVPEDTNLAYPRAYRSSTLLEIVAEAPAMLAFRCLGGDARHNIPDFQDDIPQLGGRLLEMFFDKSFW